jgi:hypothetical protein
MSAAVAPLGRIGEPEQEPFVAARQILQPRVAGRGEAERVAGDVGDRSVRRRGFAIDQIVASDDVGDARRGRPWIGGSCRRGRGRPRRLEIEVDQAMRVVERRAEHLSAGQILEGRGDAAAQGHRRRVERFSEAEARQRGAIGADQEDRLDHVAARLLDRERGDAPVVERALAHHAIDRQRQLLVDLRRRDSGVARSPRLTSASSAWALRIARSPPFTATYIRRLP